MQLLAAAVIVVSVISLAAADTVAERLPWALTGYDQAALGQPVVKEGRGVSFAGQIQVSGRLRVEADESCGEACAYFIPDSLSAERLPKRMPRSDLAAIPIEHILVFNARPLLIDALGETEASELLLPNFAPFELAATATLTDFTIYVACDKTHYDAEVVRLQSASELRKATVETKGHGC